MPGSNGESGLVRVTVMLDENSRLRASRVRNFVLQPVCYNDNAVFVFAYRMPVFHNRQT